MRKIYTGIDIGSDSIKVVVSEFFNKKFHVLASSCIPSSGVKRGLIVDKEAVSVGIKKAIAEKKEYVNFYGISGDLDKNSPYYRNTANKRGYNSSIIEYIGEFDLIINERIYNKYKERIEKK